MELSLDVYSITQIATAKFSSVQLVSIKSSDTVGILKIIFEIKTNYCLFYVNKDFKANDLLPL